MPMKICLKFCTALLALMLMSGVALAAEASPGSSVTASPEGSAPATPWVSAPAASEAAARAADAAANPDLERIAALMTDMDLAGSKKAVGGHLTAQVEVGMVVLGSDNAQKAPHVRATYYYGSEDGRGMVVLIFLADGGQYTLRDLSPGQRVEVSGVIQEVRTRARFLYLKDSVITRILPEETEPE